MATKQTVKEAPTEVGASRREALEALAMMSRRKPLGYGAIWRIVRAYDAGTELPAADLALLIDGLRAFTIDGNTDKELQEFSRRAKLRGKQGRRSTTASEAESRTLMVIDVFLHERELIKMGLSEAKAHTEATRETAKKHHKHHRKVQEAIVEYGDSAREGIRTLERVQKEYGDLMKSIRSFGGIDHMAHRADKS